MTQLTKALIILAVVGASFAAPVNQPRQLGGEGAAADSIISDTDNASGYAGENALIHIAQLLGSDAQEPNEPNGLSGSGSGGGSPPPPPPPKGRMTKMAKRQGDKLSDGAAAVLNQVGATGVADIIKTDGDAIDGQTTGDGALIGEQVGGDEEDIGERVGNLVPNKMPAAPGVPAA
ncbi:hypothetical protein FPSE_01896 [Fusarium pseudograminearum CS3096]|uniref:Uncharacterized protein n=2 Tax=Fusarium pseudograminearum TaxID=101028 RepID=K3W2N7_FUSPC|nr:hypothetical protein FPSE_01896 [Fusarium pseudograminearum CS3096]EKJ77970.1 hypothetical protein FPSE_01896 [Fusarium pseudograminearum CS3096]KAF0634688.1 hypothetical protein FPSE5266_01896 [Fusarium pseudograminearum]CEG02437.1 unnamed protein product [Fusarium pseudograminearum CS3427]